MFSKFKYRSFRKELMDDANVSKDLLFKNFQELDILNRQLGGNGNILSEIEKIVTYRDEPFKIVDIGCGSGDILKSIAIWAKKKQHNIQLTGVDINENAISLLSQHCSTQPEIKGLVADFQEFLNTIGKVDIVICNLFCHHLNDEEIINFLSLCKLKSNVFIINDLRRSILAYYLVKILTSITHATSLAKHDGPLSVLKGFREHEFVSFLNTAGIKNYSIKRKWAFRFVIVGNSLS